MQSERRPPAAYQRFRSARSQSSGRRLRKPRASGRQATGFCAQLCGQCRVTHLRARRLAAFTCSSRSSFARRLGHLNGSPTCCPFVVAGARPLNCAACWTSISGASGGRASNCVARRISSRRSAENSSPRKSLRRPYGRLRAVDYLRRSYVNTSGERENSPIPIRAKLGDEGRGRIISLCAFALNFGHQSQAKAASGGERARQMSAIGRGRLLLLPTANGGDEHLSSARLRRHCSRSPADRPAVSSAHSAVACLTHSKERTPLVQLAGKRAADFYLNELSPSILGAAVVRLRDLPLARLQRAPSS